MAPRSFWILMSNDINSVSIKAWDFPADSKAYQNRSQASAFGTITVAELPRLSAAAKRTVDILGALAGLIFLSPLLLFIAVAIKLTSPGPVFFSQTRVGRGGRTFQLYKFRTMVVNAEAMKLQLLSQNETDGPVFKMQRDPRVTRIGRILRRYSLDELPQLINILKRDMSVVGPRPPVPSEVEKYEAWQLRRLSVTPGLTCIWQVSGRSNIGFEEWMRMDLRYIDQWSLALDIKLILKTVRVVVLADGAY